MGVVQVPRLLPRPGEGGQGDGRKGAALQPIGRGERGTVRGQQVAREALQGIPSLMELDGFIEYKMSHKVNSYHKFISDHK